MRTMSPSVHSPVASRLRPGHAAVAWRVRPVRVGRHLAQTAALDGHPAWDWPRRRRAARSRASPAGRSRSPATAPPSSRAGTAPQALHSTVNAACDRGSAQPSASRKTRAVACGHRERLDDAQIRPGHGALAGQVEHSARRGQAIRRSPPTPARTRRPSTRVVPVPRPAHVDRGRPFRPYAEVEPRRARRRHAEAEAFGASREDLRNDSRSLHHEALSSLGRGADVGPVVQVELVGARSQPHPAERDCHQDLRDEHDAWKPARTPRRNDGCPLAIGEGRATCVPGSPVRQTKEEPAPCGSVRDRCAQSLY